MNNTIRTVAITLTVLVLFATVAISPTVAASETAIAVQPSETTITAGDTATVTVVLTEADRGVGAGELAIGVDDPDVATIDDVQIGGSPSFSDVSWGSDNSSATIRYAVADTNDDGEVTVLTVTVAGTAPGSTGVSVMSTSDNDDIKLFDEQGERYTITSVTPATLSITDGDDSSERRSSSTGGSAGVSSSDDADDESDPPLDEESTEDVDQDVEQDEPTEDSDRADTPVSEADDSSAPATDSEGDDTSSLNIPGFGFLSGLIALGVLSALLARRT